MTPDSYNWLMEHLPIGGVLREAIMDLNGIREALRQQPFEPFTIALADGRKLPVPHPEFVAVTPRRVIVVTDDGSWSVIEPLLVVSLDYSAGPGSARGHNGSD